VYDENSAAWGLYGRVQKIRGGWIYRKNTGLARSGKPGVRHSTDYEED